MPEFWKFLAGLGLFLLGMQYVEEALRRLTGASFRDFLRNHTRHPAEAILVGIIVTAVLQSSSLVTLMLLALTGAGVMSLRNALGVVIGANLGTTFTGWIVTTLGFKLNFDQLALPLVGIGCAGFVFLTPGRRLHDWFRFASGFGFLFLGLGFMKNSAEGLAELIDIETLAAYGLLVFLLFGFLLTAIIQSSSACMLIVLSAVNAGIIELPMAAAVVIGADLGTTMTTILGALKGSAVKRQVALAHFLFNLVTDITAFLMIHPLLELVTGTLGITDPLYGTVAFHSSFNVIGILIFYPLLGRFAVFLEDRFVEDEGHAATYLYKVPCEETALHIEAIGKDLQQLLHRCLRYNLHALDLEESLANDVHREWPGKVAAYDHIKDLQGEILAACIAVQEQPLSEPLSEQVTRIITAARAAVYSTKSVKDIYPNLLECEVSVVAGVRHFLEQLQKRQRRFYAVALTCLEGESGPARGDSLEELRTIATSTYDELWSTIREVIHDRQCSDTETATINSMNREIFASNKALAEALAASFASRDSKPASFSF